MSSILKALRKLEEEKSRRGEGTPDIARDILKSGPRGKAFPWMTFTSVAVLVIVSGLAGYVLMGNPQLPAPLPDAPQALQEMPSAGVPAPAVSAAADKTAFQVAAPAAPPPTASPAPARRSAEHVTRPEPAGKKVSPEVPSSPSFTPLPKPVPEPAATVHPPKLVEQEAVEPLPDLKLSGIAFQEDRAGRLAVINDLPVMEGTVIAGARVLEISEDRVRLDFSGRSFEVRLDGPTAAQ